MAHRSSSIRLEKPNRSPLQVQFGVELSPRQIQVLTSLASGDTVREIAVALQVTEKTVYEHIQRAKEKTGLMNMFQLGTWFVSFDLQRRFATELGIDRTE